MIESMCPIARSYAEVEKLCVDSWTYVFFSPCPLFLFFLAPLSLDCKEIDADKCDG
jgi:hypothetical protein